MSLKYEIKDSDIKRNLNRYYGYEHEIIRAAREENFTKIETDEDGTITAIDKNDREVILAEET